MELQQRVAIVTGGASGIGRALCLAFAREGAKAVVVADLDGPGAAEVAAEIRATGVAAEGARCDVSIESEVEQLVGDAESEYGAVDVFCANAGILAVGSIDAPDEVWDRAWAINVKSHLFAARAVIPRMAARGEGYLVHTASAAGLLTQLGAAPYSVTKHAVVALAEWLAITYGDAGVRVSCLCPQGVATNLGETSRAVLAGRQPRSERPAPAAGAAAAGARPIPGMSQAARDGILRPEDVADLVVEAMGDERFLILPHPEVHTYEERRAGDRDRWLRGMRRAQAQLAAMSADTRS